jgi:uncharacterized membrane protein HdeD (DUF308 family)
MGTSDSAQGSHSLIWVAKKITGWYFAIAVLFILLGLLGIIEPVAIGLGVAILVGWLLVLGGVGHVVAAFKGGGAKHVLFEVLIAIADLAGGIYFLMHPFIGEETLTLLLAVICLVGGVLRVIWYFRVKGVGGSEWLLLNGIVTLVLGGMIWSHWPSSSVWAIGILVGVKMLVTGISRLMFGLAMRKVFSPAAG